MRFFPAPFRDRAAARVIDGHTSTDFTDQPPLGHPAVARLFWLFSGGQPDRLEDGGRVKEPGRENADHRAVDKYQCRPSSCGQALAHDSTPEKKSGWGCLSRLPSGVPFLAPGPGMQSMKLSPSQHSWWYSKWGGAGAREGAAHSGLP